MPERLLMGPGPSNPYPEVTAALVHPVLGHLDPVFLGLLDETMARLRTVFATANRLTLPLSGTGSAGMEATFVNLVRPGDPVVVGVNGLFGERMCEVAGRQGAEVVRVEAPWGRPLDPEAVLEAHPAPAVIARGARRDLHRDPQRRGRARRRQGRRAVGRRHRDLARGHRGGGRRLGGGHRLQRHPEVPRRPAGAVAPDRVGPGP